MFSKDQRGIGKARLQRAKQLKLRAHWLLYLNQGFNWELLCALWFHGCYGQQNLISFDKHIQCNKVRQQSALNTETQIKVIIDDVGRAQN